MNYDTLKKQTQIRGAIALVAVILTVGVSVYISHMQSTTQTRLYRERNQTIQQQTKLQRLLQQKKEFAESIKLWKQLSGDSKSLSGLKIDESKDVLRRLENTYKLSNTSIIITPPEELYDIYKNDTTVVVSSKVTYAFETITDEIAFAFINELPKKLPGYIKIVSLKMERHGELNNDTITQLYEGTPVGLVRTHLVFHWRDIKNIAEEAELTNDTDAL